MDIYAEPMELTPEEIAGSDLDSRMKRKYRTYSKVRQVMSNLANGETIQPFAGINVTRRKDRAQLGNEMARQALSEELGQNIKHPTSDLGIRFLTGWEHDPYRAANYLRTPRLRQGVAKPEYEPNW